MSPHTETHHEEFTYFNDAEAEAIEAWLSERGYGWDKPTLCGSCCGFWDDQYWVNLSEADIAAFNEWAALKALEIVARHGGIHIR